MDRGLVKKYAVWKMCTPHWRRRLAKERGRRRKPQEMGYAGGGSARPSYQTF